MQAPFKQLTRLMTRRSRGGQSIILIAFAFIALIAFVGIATDVAMLFVRFSTLRRAVDAAAIATAGQIRETSNYMTLNAVAKEFMNIHGIDPSQVKVETCDTEIMTYISQHPLDDAQEARAALISGTDSTHGQTLTGLPVSELCKTNPQKFVRVTAALNSQTAFLSLLGWRSVMLETSSVAQTAVLDVALVLDASMSEVNDTLNREHTDTGYYPCTLEGTDTSAACNTDADHNTRSSNSEALKNFKDFTNPSPSTVDGSGNPVFPTISDNTSYGPGLKPFGDASGEPLIREECWMQLYRGNYATDANYGWAGCCNDPSTQTNSSTYPADKGFDGSTYIVRTYNDMGTGDVHRPELVKGFNPDPNWYLYDADTLNESVIMTTGTNPFLSGAAAATVVSGQPDGNFSDLVCQPFRQVRDAARRFIRRLDFNRGDRAILVTFDAGARAIYPYPYDPSMTGGPYGAMGSTIPIFTDEGTAVRTLNMQVGVEVNPLPIERNVCAVFPSLTTADTKTIYRDESKLPLKPGVPGDPSTYNYRYKFSDYFLDSNPKQTVSYWTITQCNDTNSGGGIQAATSAIVNPNWIRRESVWVMIVLSDGYPNRTPIVGNGGIGSAKRDWLQVANLPGAPSGYGMPSSTDGGADALTIAKYCDTKIEDPANPGSYITNPNYSLQPQWCITDQQGVDTSATTNRSPKYTWAPLSGTNNDLIGSMGFCPWWTFCQLEKNQTQCTENNPAGIWQGASTKENGFTAPQCSDTDPNSRHSCMDGNGRINPGGYDESGNPLPANPGSVDEYGANIEDKPWPKDYYCDPHYDADDYARDRADYAGLVNYMDRSLNKDDLSKAGPAKRGNFIAIYSIFFDHKQIGQTPALGNNILGIKFMRYLADVGDNGFIDNHLQRWYRDVRDGVKLPKTGIYSYPTGDAAKTWRNPPIGLNEGVDGQNQAATKPFLGVAGNPGVTNKAPAPTGGQPVPPSYNGQDGTYLDKNDSYIYPQEEDPCAQYDYSELGLTPDGSGTSQYEVIAKTSCGQFFYVTDSTTINRAFTQIAGRLFTRLSR